MLKYYKRQDVIHGFLYDGKQDPTQVFPEDTPLTYQAKAKAWFLYDDPLRAGFYYPDGFGRYKFIPLDHFNILYSEKPYALAKDGFE
jgi:hypothetical protein